MRRPADKHIDNKELDALVPSSHEAGKGAELSPDVLRAVKRHLDSCVDCSEKVSKYWQLVHGFSKRAATEGVAPVPDCPQGIGVDWPEVASGRWPELKAAQLIMHAALCDHCGPLLRAATSIHGEPTSQEGNLHAELPPSSCAQPITSKSSPALSHRQSVRWLIPAFALMVIVGLLSMRPSSSSVPLSGPDFARLAVATHRQHEEGKLPLEIRSNSQRILDSWFKTRSELALALPSSPAAPGEDRPYQLEGARLVQIRGKSTAFIAYQVKNSQEAETKSRTAELKMIDASLIVTPTSVAVASGGVKVDYKKVSFHYATVAGYKVVTWSQHGLTYALVSQESNATQRSCMICHSAMGDRDLSQVPTPLHAVVNSAVPILQ